MFLKQVVVAPSLGIGGHVVCNYINMVYQGFLKILTFMTNKLFYTYLKITKRFLVCNVTRIYYNIILKVYTVENIFLYFSTLLFLYFSTLLFLYFFTLLFLFFFIY